MNSIKIHPLWLLLIVFAAGYFVCHILAAQRDTRYELVGFKSRLVQLEARNLQIEDAKVKWESRFKCVDYLLRFGELTRQLLGKFHFWH